MTYCNCHLNTLATFRNFVFASTKRTNKGYISLRNDTFSKGHNRLPTVWTFQMRMIGSGRFFLILFHSSFLLPREGKGTGLGRPLHRDVYPEGYKKAGAIFIAPAFMLLYRDFLGWSKVTPVTWTFTVSTVRPLVLPMAVATASCTSRATFWTEEP